MSRSKFLRHNPQESFICRSCGNTVPPLKNGGSQRNHCPHCLSSIHVDILPGDRRASCHGVMNPISVWVQENKEWSIIHRCVNCGTLRTNRIAADDNEIMLFSLAASFMSQLPFPAEKAIHHIQALSRKKESSYES